MTCLWLEADRLADENSEITELPVKDMCDLSRASPPWNESPRLVVFVDTKVSVLSCAISNVPTLKPMLEGCDVGTEADCCTGVALNHTKNHKKQCKKDARCNHGKEYIKKGVSNKSCEIYTKKQS